MDTYQEAKEYLAKGNQGKKWYISLVYVFAHLPEGDERIDFAQKYVGDTKFGKDFIEQYKPDAPYKKSQDNGKTSMELELESYDTFLKSLDSNADKMKEIASHLQKEMNGNASEVFLIHLFLQNVVWDLCCGKIHHIILSRAESLLSHGFAEEAFHALNYIDSDWRDPQVNLATQFLIGGFYKNWEGVSIPISEYADYVPKDEMDEISDIFYDKVLAVENDDSLQQNFQQFDAYYNKAKYLLQKGYGHHTPQDIDIFIAQLWKTAGNSSDYDPAKISVEQVLQSYRRHKEEKQKLHWKEKADEMIRFILTGETDDSELLEDEDVELSDVLDGIISDYPEDMVTYIFMNILVNGNREIKKYIKDYFPSQFEWKESKEQKELWKKKADEMIRFIKTGKTDDPELLEYEDVELSDVLKDVLDYYPEDIQTDIFIKILDDEDKEKVRFILSFFEKEIYNIPYELARELYFNHGFEAAEDIIRADEEYKQQYGIDDGFLDEDEEFECLTNNGTADLEVIDSLAEKFPRQAACVYFDRGDSIKALETYYLYDDICFDLEYEDKRDWLVNVLQSAKDTDADRLKEIIKKYVEKFEFEYFDEDLSKWFLGTLDLEVIDSLADEFPQQAAHVYFDRGDSIKALETYYLNEDIYDDLEYEDKRDWFVNVLQSAKETDADRLKKIIKKYVVKFEEEYDDEDLSKWFLDTLNGLGLKPHDIELQQSVEKHIEQQEEESAKQEQNVDEIPEHKEESEPEQTEQDAPDGSQEKDADEDEAEALFAQYKKKGGIKILRKAAKLGHAEAQYQLGLHCLELHQATPFWKKAIKAIKGTRTNKEKAMWWFKKAAEQGHAEAKKMLKK